MAIFDPHRIHTPWPITKKLIQVIISVAPTAVPNLVQIRRWGLLGKWVKYNDFFIYTFFQELTYRSDQSTEFHTWKRLFTPQKLGFSGDFTPKWGAMSTKPPKGTSLRESAQTTRTRAEWKTPVFGAWIRYDTRCYFNVRSKADISQLNLPHGTDN